MLVPPIFDAGNDYGAQLGSVDFWLPYAEVALALSGLPLEPMVSGFTGTYPTLVGPTLVVKMFGHFGGWRRSVQAETAANAAIGTQEGILAPRIVAAGELFPNAENDWPYLISERLPGQAWRDAPLTGEQRMDIAGEVGRQAKRVHACRPRRDAQMHGDWLVERRDNTVERQRAWGILPERLLDQIPELIASYRPTRTCLVHGDITEDHIFVEDGALVGIIDWGDAMISDPFYELGALHLGAFGADRRLLGSFLEGYGWPIDGGFAIRAMQVAVMHEFDLFTGVSDLVRQADSLTDLAHALFSPIAW